MESLLDNCPWLNPDEDYEVDPSFNYEHEKNHCKTLEGEVDKLKRTAKMNIDDHSYQKLH